MRARMLGVVEVPLASEDPRCRPSTRNDRSRSRWLVAAVVLLLVACDEDPDSSGHVAPVEADASCGDTRKYGEGVRWAADLDEAMARGRAEEKPVLVVFSALRQERCGGEHEY